MNELAEAYRDRWKQEKMRNFELQDAHTDITARYTKLKKLLLLTDSSVSDVEMNELTTKQWNAFIEEFPDEAI